MKIGILTDLHEDAARLDQAVAILRGRGAERFVVLGDLFRSGGGLDRIVERLLGYGIEEAVWGNHDIGLSRLFEVPRESYRVETIRYMRELEPWIDRGECRFQHLPPHHDPMTIEGMWSCSWEEFSRSPGELEACFSACTQRLIFMGHFHSWMHATPAGITDWAGGEPLDLSGPGRHLIAVHAVTDGGCALFDEERSILTPYAW
jgi:hypothetical protein